MMGVYHSKMLIYFRLLPIINIPAGPRLFGMPPFLHRNLSLLGEFFMKKCQRTSISFKEDVKFPLSAACVPWLQNLQFIFFWSVTLLSKFGIGCDPF